MFISQRLYHSCVGILPGSNRSQIEIIPKLRICGLSAPLFDFRGCSFNGLAALGYGIYSICPLQEFNICTTHCRALNNRSQSVFSSRNVHTRDFKVCDVCLYPRLANSLMCMDYSDGSIYKFVVSCWYVGQFQNRSFVLSDLDSSGFLDLKSTRGGPRIISWISAFRTFHNHEFLFHFIIDLGYIRIIHFEKR